MPFVYRSLIIRLLGSALFRRDVLLSNIYYVIPRRGMLHGQSSTLHPSACFRTGRGLTRMTRHLHEVVCKGAF